MIAINELDMNDRDDSDDVRESGVVPVAKNTMRAQPPPMPSSRPRFLKRSLTPHLVRAVAVDPTVEDAGPVSDVMEMAVASVDAFGDTFRLPRHSEIVVITRFTSRDRSLDALEKYVLTTVEIVRMGRCIPVARAQGRTLVPARFPR